MPNIAYINGKWMNLSKARVSVEDRGFQFGDGVYELIRTYDGRPFQLKAHLERLRKSMEAIGLKNRYPKNKWEDIIRKAIIKSGIGNSKIYIQVTRGVAPRNHVVPKRSQTTVVVTTRPIHPLSPHVILRGVRVITLPDPRWSRCDIKSINLLPNILARQVAESRGAREAIFYRRGRILEGTSSNIFILSRGSLRTPPLGVFSLSGVTRDCVIRLAKKSRFPVIEKDITITDLMRADEVFLTGTTIEILPVVRVDQRVVGQGAPGPVTKYLIREFRQLTSE